MRLMRIIDLSKPIFDHMPVFPGDPDVELTKIQTLEKEGWNMHRISMNLHDGTHVNAPIHMAQSGKTLDDLSLDRFIGPCVLYAEGMTFTSDTGVLFVTHNVTPTIADRLIQTPPKFIGVSERFEFDIALEQRLLEHDMISFENLTNTEALPESFMFYGLPLRFVGGDGSPVRAIAVIT